jgi:hypothetical protein
MHTIPAVTCSFCRASVLAFSNAARAFSWCTETHDEDSRPSFCRVVNVKGGFNRSTKAEDVRCFFCVLFPSSSSFLVFFVAADPFVLPTGAVADPFFKAVAPSPPEDFFVRRRRRRPSCVSVVSSFAAARRVNVLLLLPVVVVVPVGRSATTRIESVARALNSQM